MSSNEFRGRRLVVGLYLALVAFTGVAGVLFGSVVDDPVPPKFLFLVELPPTRLGFALYGALTVALVLGIPLAAIALLSDRVDDAAVAPPEDE